MHRDLKNGVKKIHFAAKKAAAYFKKTFFQKKKSEKKKIKKLSMVNFYA